MCRSRAFAETENHRLARLASKAQRGDLDVFRQLCQAYARRILNCAYQVTGKRKQAESLTVEIFRTAYRDLSRLQQDSNFELEPWLFELAQDKIAQAARQDSHSHTAVFTMINSVPDKLKRVFILSAIGKCRYQIIAKILSCSAKTIQRDIHCARMQVRKSLNEYLARPHNRLGEEKKRLFAVRETSSAPSEKSFQTAAK